MSEHLVAMLALLFGAACSLIALALAVVGPRGIETVVLGSIVFVVGAWYYVDVTPLIVGGFRARWAIGA